MAGQQIDPGTFRTPGSTSTSRFPSGSGATRCSSWRVAKNTYVLCAVARLLGALPINVNSIDIAECGSIPSDDTANGTAGSFDQRNWITT